MLGILLRMSPNPEDYMNNNEDPMKEIKQEAIEDSSCIYCGRSEERDNATINAIPVDNEYEPIGTADYESVCDQCL